MGLLNDIANKYNTDKGTNAHAFTVFYEQFFDSIREKVLKVLEIGIGPSQSDPERNAPSLKMWRDYFPKATVYGADIDPRCHFFDERIESIWCDQSDEKSLEKVIATCGNDVDIIIDDGSHNIIHQQSTLAYMFQHVKPGGFYVLEDIHTSLEDGWGLPANDCNSTYMVIKRLAARRKLESPYAKPIFDVEFCQVYEDSDKKHITSVIKKSLQRLEH